jgi:hypothetical protein
VERTLRRTFASILAVCDVPPRRAMYLMGRTDPTLTLAVYQQQTRVVRSTRTGRVMPIRESVLTGRDEAVRCWRRTVRLVLKRHPDLIDLRLRLLHARSLDDHCPHCFQRTVQRLARRSEAAINGKP